MSPAERQALESQVDRHVRRGELGEAYAKLQQLAEAFPDDAGLAERLANLEQSLDPAERRRVAITRPEPSGAHKTPVHQAEAFAAQGRYAEAVAIYRQLLEARPDWELGQERLAELFQLARVVAPTKPPVNRAQVLEHLLERISTRKRG